MIGSFFSVKLHSICRKPFTASWAFRPTETCFDNIKGQYVRTIINFENGVPTKNLPSGYDYAPFTVGDPFHFYFGMVKGNSALDKFKTKYSVDE